MKKLLIIAVIASLLVGFSHNTEASAAQNGGVYYKVVQINSPEEAQSILNSLQSAGSLNPTELQNLLHQLLQGNQQIQPPSNGQTEKQPAETPQARQKQANQDEQPAAETSAQLSAEEQQMVNLVNAERQKQGLPALKVNMELVQVARVKAQDMIDHQYFGHHSPTYGSPTDMLNAFGVKYRTAGENLAGNQTVERAHQSLMNSDGHRANILNGNYTEIGIGIVNGGPYGKMFVQLFKG